VSFNLSKFSLVGGPLESNLHSQWVVFPPVWIASCPVDPDRSMVLLVKLWPSCLLNILAHQTTSWINVALWRKEFQRVSQWKEASLQTTETDTLQTPCFFQIQQVQKWTSGEELSPLFCSWPIAPDMFSVFRRRWNLWCGSSLLPHKMWAHAWHTKFERQLVVVDPNWPVSPKRQWTAKCHWQLVSIHDNAFCSAWMHLFSLNWAGQCCWAHDLLLCDATVILHLDFEIFWASFLCPHHSRRRHLPENLAWWWFEEGACSQSLGQGTWGREQASHHHCGNCGLLPLPSCTQSVRGKFVIPPQTKLWNEMNESVKMQFTRQTEKLILMVAPAWFGSCVSLKKIWQMVVDIFFFRDGCCLVKRFILANGQFVGDEHWHFFDVNVDLLVILSGEIFVFGEQFSTSQNWVFFPWKLQNNFCSLCKLIFVHWDQKSKMFRLWFVQIS